MVRGSPTTRLAPHHEGCVWRSILRHDYDSIVDRVILEVVERDLPTLKDAIAAIESRLDEPGD